MQIKIHVLSAHKWMTSFFKKDWQVQDYPLYYREQNTSIPEIPRWEVHIIKWWQMSGLGNTKDEAIADLEKSLTQYKIDQPLPRPGSHQETLFASSEKIEEYWPIANLIVSEILGHNTEEMVITDQTSLHHLTDKAEYKVCLQDIKDAFGVDVSHIESGNLVEVCECVIRHRLGDAYFEND